MSGRGVWLKEQAEYYWVNWEKGTRKPSSIWPKIYTELKAPEAIVRSALHESADHIGITTLRGADIQAFEEILRLLKAENAGSISVTAGGFLDDEDIERIKKMGVMAFFPKGTTFDEIVEWSRENIKIKQP